ncbi:metallothionein-like protein 1 [Selaginella moellendorffii]|uniref:metallothionein-like protein 1 n=1 Tax=Selaginella moellendorffii TaxID=88036 RepID=UPI000D1C2248|nr:metallothionein-like protein 1 [Selaginella moellendorffii]|eukprot:XP_024535883.1 metallothionein-like protein 1 [Selaginella moellendorffii]
MPKFFSTLSSLVLIAMSSSSCICSTGCKCTGNCTCKIPHLTTSMDATARRVLALLPTGSAPAESAGGYELEKSCAPSQYAIGEEIATAFNV